VRYGSIPFYTPKCNAYVERFHGLCDQFFWTRRHFSDTVAVSRHYPAFLRAFRENYAVQRLPDQTPAQARQTLLDVRVRTLAKDLKWQAGRSLPLVSGQVHCVRRTDSHGRLSVLGQFFTLQKKYRLAYIRATLAVADQQVTFYYQETQEQEPELVSTQHFPLPADAIPWDASLAAKYLV
jgi:hypothetical protein